MKVIIIGGGWAGTSAAISAKKAGAEVELYEKTDLLLGLGNVGGIMRNNGRYTATEELIALGVEDIFSIIDSCCIHKNIDFPGHKHAYLYNVTKIEGEIRDYLKSIGIKLFMEQRVVDVKLNRHRIEAIKLADGSIRQGDVFVEATGSTGPMGNCLRYGNGCSMCILRCPAFGPRISVSERCGVADMQGERCNDMLGAFSGSCKLSKESLSEDLKKELEENGVVVLSIPKEDINYKKLESKVCQQYALKEFAENVVILDTGEAKLMTTHYNLEKLRKIKGMEHVKFIDPYAGSKGNSIRYLSVAPRTNDMKVIGVDNLFVAGEKSGLFVGHTEAIASGALAGHNSVRYVMGIPLLILPSSIAIGDIIAYENVQAKTYGGRKERYTFAGAGYFKRMQEKGLYTLDIKKIRNRITKINLDNVFNQRLC